MPFDKFLPNFDKIIIFFQVFIYLLFLVLILPSIGGTTLEGMVEYFIHNKPHVKVLTNDTIRWDCIFLPNNGAFFVNYVITSSLVGNAIVSTTIAIIHS